VGHVTLELGVSERRACRVLGQHRSTQRKAAKTPDDEAALTADIMALALRYGRYGYRRITAMLHQAGWIVNVKRVKRIWRREGLKVPSKQPKRGRQWLNDSSFIRIRPEYPNHVWSYDFVEDRTHNGKKTRMPATNASRLR
jgi:transposase InsO family protein